MKYRCTGSNHETGARMVMELEAQSKAAAERKAAHAGMDVNHAEAMLEGVLEPAQCRGRRPSKASLAGIVAKFAVLFVLGAVAYILRGPIMTLIHR
jgi:hypothetical protein